MKIVMKYVTATLCLHDIFKGKEKIKVTLIQALRLCTGRKADRGVEV
jgi:hypothetical protein